MYRGFRLASFNIENTQYSQKLYQIGKSIFEESKFLIQKSLDEFIYSDNSIDGTSIQNYWFPQVESEVFISHSHKDQKMALILAGWLKSEFNITSFIDSCIWGYANNLLREIDNKYCKNLDGKTYNYDKRNFSTSHVHMMLSTALSMMIDKTECLFFLNTPHSIIPNESINKDETESPWIYFEIGMSKVVRKKEPIRILTEGVRFYSGGEVLEKSMKAKYEVDLSHLTEINYRVLNKWRELGAGDNPENALDELYKLKPPKKYSDSLHS